MASVTFPVAIGGNGSTVSDDSNVSTGLANGGHRTRFVPALAQVVGIGNLIVPLCQNALVAPGTSATSASSLTIGTGSKSLTLAQAQKAFAVGQWVQIADTAAPATNWMHGAITAFNSGLGTMTVDVKIAAGTGTLTAWAVHPASPMSPFLSINANGELLLGQPTSSLGYAAGSGAGSSVTQIGSKAGGVTIAAPNGRIVMNAASLAAGARVSFTMTNGYLNQHDHVLLRIGRTGTPTAYSVQASDQAAGLFNITVKNESAGALAEAIEIYFAIFRGSIT